MAVTSTETIRRLIVENQVAWRPLDIVAWRPLDIAALTPEQQCALDVVLLAHPGCEFLFIARCVATAKPALWRQGLSKDEMEGVVEVRFYDWDGEKWAAWE